MQTEDHALNGRLHSLWARLGGELARAGALSLVIKLAGTGLVLLATLLIARLLGPEAFGVYALAFSVMSLMAVPLTFSLAYLMVREVPAAETVKAWGRLRGVLGFARRTVILYAAVAVGLGSLVLLAGHGVLDARYMATLASALLVLPFWSASEVAGGALRGLGRVAAAQVPELVVKPVLLVMAALGLAAALAPAPPGPAQMMAAHAGVAMLAALMALALLRRHVPAPAWAAKAVDDAAAWRASLTAFTGLAIAQGLLASVDLLLLGLIAGSRPAGIYRIAMQGALLVALAPAALNIALSPLIVRLHAAGEREALERALVGSARAMLLITAPAALLLALLGRPLIELLFGADYAEAAVPLAILCAGQAVSAAFGTAGTALALTGHAQDTAKGTATGALVCGGLALALIPWAGPAGAAVASATGLIAANVALSRRLRARAGLASHAFWSTPRRA